MTTEDEDQFAITNELPRPVPLFESIYDLIWAAIFRGDIKPGARLKDVDWARRLSVSRTPVREAMRRLHQEGILVPLVQGGYEMKRVNEEDLRNLYICRASLERAATQQASARITSKEIAALRLVINQCDQAIERNDFQVTFDLNTEFHDKIVAIADNSYLTSVYGLIKRHIIFARRSLLNAVNGEEVASSLYRQRLLRKQAEHRAILKMISDGDHSQAAALMEEHLINSSKHFSTQERA